MNLGRGRRWKGAFCWGRERSRARNGDAEDALWGEVVTTLVTKVVTISIRAGRHKQGRQGTRGRGGGGHVGDLRGGSRAERGRDSCTLRRELRGPIAMLLLQRLLLLQPLLLLLLVTGAICGVRGVRGRGRKVGRGRPEAEAADATNPASEVEGPTSGGDTSHAHATRACRQREHQTTHAHGRHVNSGGERGKSHVQTQSRKRARQVKRKGMVDEQDGIRDAQMPGPTKGIMKATTSRNTTELIRTLKRKREERREGEERRGEERREEERRGEESRGEGRRRARRGLPSAEDM